MGAQGADSPLRRPDPEQGQALPPGSRRGYNQREHLRTDCAIAIAIAIAIVIAEWGSPSLEPNRIDVYDARESVLRGEALLVNAYEPDWEFRAVRLEGAIPLKEFEGLIPTLPGDQKIVVYCA